MPCGGSGYLVAFSIILLNLALPLHGQYLIHSWSVAGGGGASSGGNYRVTGSIGPSDAGAAMTGGHYIVMGGYWPAVATDPGSPALAIELATPGELRISWTPDSPGWVLQQRSSLLPSEWVTIPASTTNPTVIQAGDSTKFYRLMRSE